MFVWAAHASTSPRFHQPLALVTCFYSTQASPLYLAKIYIYIERSFIELKEGSTRTGYNPPLTRDPQGWEIESKNKTKLKHHRNKYTKKKLNTIKAHTSNFETSCPHPPYSLYLTLPESKSPTYACDYGYSGEPALHIQTIYVFILRKPDEASELVAPQSGQYCTN